MNFKEKYGSWAFVAGGSEGMGGAYSDYLAKQGMNVIVSGRHAETVNQKVQYLQDTYQVDALPLVIDLGKDDSAKKIMEFTKELEIGFLVYNAGLAYVGYFKELDPEFELYRLNINVRTPIQLVLHYSKQMAERKHGGIILMSSTSGTVGSPYFTTYAATKAYLLNLGESLWAELKEDNVDVISIVPGATIGQSFKEIPVGTPGFMTGEEVVAEAFQYLGKYPSRMVGQHNIDLHKDVYDADKRKEMVLKLQELDAQFLPRE